MAAHVPAKLKDADIAQFAQRAAQLEKFRPIITYWLRFYITQKIIAKGLHLVDAECTAYTTDLMGQLEQTKAEHPTEDALLDEMAAYAYCEQFALETFGRADNAIRTNKVTAQTVDTLRAAITFFELLTVWKNPPESEVAAKLKFARFHAVRILKALKAGEDPNLSNPKEELPPQPISPPALEADDPEAQRITGPPHNPYQPYVESAPDTSVQPSPTFSASRVSPPPNLPSAPTGYSQSTPQTYHSHRDVSPISQPATSRQGSVVSVGGGYFPRVDVPTFTADNAAPGLPTAPSLEDEPMTSPFHSSPLPQAPQAPQAPDPQSFYQNQAPPPARPQPPSVPQAPPVQQTPQQQQPPPPQTAFQSPTPHYAAPPPTQSPYQPPAFQPAPAPPPQQYQYSPQAPNPFQQQPPQQYAPAIAQQVQQGPLRRDEEAVLEAQKHAKWAISALNFEDVDTAVKELRIALRALGAN
ncbi:DUF605-domain-containing protein [Amniculicola lignicola CBS 123094]|uniref:DUF605-domain-containing protein n=1 Tax=Amniculicola lignicola CBS 123094 TaxID=1392246 RepID=A0A6A5VY48_9PLEO|nr:DUF605-domain-containing protein [Amniculicola lignicola CBS 123094]